MKKQIHIDTSTVIGTPNPKMWGIFYEEINHAGDGGLYAELLKNRNFADSDLPEGTSYANGVVRTKQGHKENFSIADPLPGWSVRKTENSSAFLEKTTESPRNPECAAQLKMTFFGSNRLVNSGYWGISAPAGEYRGTLIARSTDISAVTVGLMRKDGSVLGSTVIDSIGAEYQKVEFVLTTSAGDTDARFFVEVEGNGAIWFDFISLFPADTYHGVKHGFRKDVLAMLQGMKPGFLRFPGGCVVEGINLENAIHWKKTIGPIEDRPGHWDLWGYRCTDGLGMLEFCLLGEALDADLMYVCNCGMSCQARQSEHVEGEALNEWLQNALDGIEYIYGDPSTPWGAKRAADGHPEPFHLKYVEIGNENNGDVYFERYSLFRAAIAEKYPELILISNCDVPGETYDLRDDHYYTPPQTFPSMYGKYAGEGQKVYVGEYACNKEVGAGNLLGAVSEATFMCDMENCCDRVRIASYAPLFCHEQDQTWSVNLIHFDRNHTFGLPSYYVQKLFAQNAVEQVVANDNEVKKGALTNLYLTAGIAGKELVLKAANFGPEITAAEFLSDAIAAGACKVLTVAGESEFDTNTILYPQTVSDVETSAVALEGKLTVALAPYSFTVLRIPMK